MVIRSNSNGSGDSQESTGLAMKRPKPRRVNSAPKPRRVNSARRFLVTTHEDHPTIVAATEDPPEPPVTSLSGLLDSFTNMCMCREQERELRKYHHHKTLQASDDTKRARVVYPVEMMEGFHLNSERLIEERRQSLQHQTLFRPVSEDATTYTAR